ncbi:hypothetical protein [Flavobacterium filum]|mgnify:CR=1 FL=1|uniref:hypothetical protein n=1 Tax=Flavobacterium filum TaxID=370974 RepID=UPI0023F42A06|nr:hypothetical protein [Flavobacterium filum]
MKYHNRYKLRQLHNGNEFYSERHQGCSYYSLIPRKDGLYELLKNGEYQPFIIVCRVKDELIAFGVGSRQGYLDTIHLDDIQFLDLNFIDESNFEGENENFTASFNGEEVLLFAGEENKPDKFYIENSLG